MMICRMLGDGVVGPCIGSGTFVIDTWNGASGVPATTVRCPLKMDAIALGSAAPAGTAITVSATASATNSVRPRANVLILIAHSPPGRKPPDSYDFLLTRS
jgi:hypothetical protein